jgi:hypothetical protein
MLRAYDRDVAQANRQRNLIPLLEELRCCPVMDELKTNFNMVSDRGRWFPLQFRIRKPKVRRFDHQLAEAQSKDALGIISVHLARITKPLN